MNFICSCPSTSHAHGDEIRLVGPLHKMFKLSML